MTDILEELDRWIAEWKGVGDFHHPRLPHLKRARDEIAVLRQEIEDFAASMPARMDELNIAVRAKALEEAARVCNTFMVAQMRPDPQQLRAELAAAIRALKGEIT